MGISEKDAKIIIRLARDGHIPKNASIIEIGAQQLSNAFLRAKETITELGDVFEVTSAPPFPEQGERSETVHGNVEHQSSDAPSARMLWDWLGIDYAAIDIDGTPGSVPLDLNFDAVPPDYRHRFNLVTNCGTTEHVANQLNAFEVIHDLTALGGVMIHNLPAQGFLNHGLVNYNLKFFWMLARSNGYRWLYADFELGGEPYGLPQNIIDNVKPYEASIEQRAVGFMGCDCGIAVALQKVFDFDFVAPIDVPTGMTTDDPRLRYHYWTVFEADAFTGESHRFRRWPWDDDETFCRLGEKDLIWRKGGGELRLPYADIRGIRTYRWPQLLLRPGSLRAWDLSAWGRMPRCRIVMKTGRSFVLLSKSYGRSGEVREESFRSFVAALAQHVHAANPKAKIVGGWQEGR